VRRLLLQCWVNNRRLLVFTSLLYWLSPVCIQSVQSWKKLPRYYQPFWFTWIVVSPICVVYITLARRTCLEYSHWLIIFNQPMKIFLANVWQHNKDTARLIFILNYGRQESFFRLEMQGVALERLLNDSPWSYAFVPPSILPTPAVAAAEYPKPKCKQRLWHMAA